MKRTTLLAPNGGGLCSWAIADEGAKADAAGDELLRDQRPGAATHQALPQQRHGVGRPRAQAGDGALPAGARMQPIPGAQRPMVAVGAHHALAAEGVVLLE